MFIECKNANYRNEILPHQRFTDVINLRGRVEGRRNRGRQKRKWVGQHCRMDGEVILHNRRSRTRPKQVEDTGVQRIKSAPSHRKALRAEPEPET